MTLATGQVCSILNVSRFTLREWLQAGLIKPQKGTRGTGDHRQFSLVDIVAIAIGRGMLQ
ncbi:MAG: MerR family transcriptional regulator [Planctomycetota bacterium]